MTYEWLIHDDHHKHPLQLVFDERPFSCDGCLEMGLGSRYACVNQCGYLLHKDCANPTDTLTHPFFPGRVFHFLDLGEPNHRCDACGGDINGFVYHCFLKDLDLHPCCANLKHHVPVPAEEGNMTLVLRKEESSKCYRCGKKRLNQGATSWMYVSEHGRYHFHVSCAKKNVAEAVEECFLGGKGVGIDVEVNRSRALEKRLPELPRKTRKFAKVKKIVQITITLVMAAVVGDPTALVAALIANLIAH